MTLRTAAVLAAALSAALGGVPPGCEPDAPSTTANGNVTIVTQSTLDRLWNVGHICERWKGPLSLGMMVKHEDPSAVKQDAKRIMAACPEVRVSVVVSKPEDKYPVNRLRNLAWAKATTPWIFLLDADFWPGAYARFLWRRPPRRRRRPSKTPRRRGPRTRRP